MQDTIRRFHSALPQIRAWIDQYLGSNAATARKLDSMPPLSTAFPPDRFLLAYGFGLLQYGYEQSPLEKMAYDLEQQFMGGSLPNDLARFIEDGSDAIWNQVAPIV